MYLRPSPNIVQLIRLIVELFGLYESVLEDFIVTTLWLLLFAVFNFQVIKKIAILIFNEIISSNSQPVIVLSN